ncbi:hypothetical protein [Streptosporangium canum]|uniref:hypothetical protein n=1 Tax=Streptosporangium canum TaxID=324952 RepID=UPI0033AC5D7F
MKSPEFRLLWMAIILIASMIIGIAGGVLARIEGGNLAQVILAGAGGFVGMVTVSLMIAHFLTGA